MTIHKVIVVNPSGDWRDSSVNDLQVTTTAWKMLAKAGINTVGQLVDLLKVDPTLDGVKGIGNRTAESIHWGLEKFLVDRRAEESGR